MGCDQDDVAGVYALFASVFLTVPNGETRRLAAQLLEAGAPEPKEETRSCEDAGARGLIDCMDDGTIAQRFYDRMVTTVSPLYVPAVESCMVDAREGEGGCLEAGRVDGARMTEVLACYKMYGFDYRLLNGFRPLVGSMRPDHLAAELAFMAYLRRLQALETAQGKTAGEFADKFLQRHLRAWLPTLCAFARQCGPPDAYVNLFEAARRWVELDALTARASACGRSDLLPSA